MKSSSIGNVPIPNDSKQQTCCMIWTKDRFGDFVLDLKREGHIGFQDHGANVWFRNIRIRQL